ncbi:MAG TPA: GH1 family beta-glucosidase [Actinophytocola sp.]|uniref:GH1 family beta-glucosidase n=1 Tax=Actinophytocola sp. TaxID=1872138 RepID=UPI002DB93BBF|nr:GH1 family beta-glucosidase [Actinophytocola sp.]HEU5474400.1 GH1 family beta-glucosidase [Actinophytocola sp.]
MPDEVRSTSDVEEEVAHRFPPGFVWGAATAAFQIEGSTTVDGRSDSIWDEFCRRPGAVKAGDTGDPATDHYRQYERDVALMAELGLGAYRFSIAWPRVRPDGGAVNQRGLDFYERLVDRLLENNIAPWATFYHWDLPQALEERGGWTNRDTAYRYADYVDAVLRRLGDRVPVYTTFNEPWCSAFLGYASGIHAPGRTEPRAAVAAVHHLLLAHGLGMAAVRELALKADAGVTLNLFPVAAADPDSPADREVARLVDGMQNRIFLDPVLCGQYPPDMVEHLAPYGLVELIKEGDLDLISAPLDLLGVNYYRGHLVAAGEPRTGPTDWIGVDNVDFLSSGMPLTDSGWEVQPPGLVDVLVRLHEEYPPVALHITENGAAYRDVIDADGTINDLDRIAFLDAHLRAAHTAIEHGVDLRGYFYWSLLDNFEWAEGYAKRFGIVHVDYTTQLRTPKRSARWYSKVIADNGLPRAAG